MNLDDAHHLLKSKQCQGTSLRRDVSKLHYQLLGKYITFIVTCVGGSKAPPMH